MLMFVGLTQDLHTQDHRSDVQTKMLEGTIRTRKVQFYAVWEVLDDKNTKATQIFKQNNDIGCLPKSSNTIILYLWEGT